MGLFFIVRFYILEFLEFFKNCVLGWDKVFNI